MSVWGKYTLGTGWESRYHEHEIVDTTQVFRFRTSAANSVTYYDNIYYWHVPQYPEEKTVTVTFANSTENAPTSANMPTAVTNSIYSGSESTVIDLTANIPTTTEAYAFKGWSYTDNGAVIALGTTEFKPVVDQTLYAVWEEIVPGAYFEDFESYNDGDTFTSNSFFKIPATGAGGTGTVRVDENGNKYLEISGAWSSFDVIKKTTGLTGKEFLQFEYKTSAPCFVHNKNWGDNVGSGNIDYLTSSAWNYVTIDNELSSTRLCGVLQSGVATATLCVDNIYYWYIPEPCKMTDVTIKFENSDINAPDGATMPSDIVKEIYAGEGSETIDLNTVVPTNIPDGYKFAGWSYSKNGAAITFGADAFKPVASLTLYAIWQDESKTVYVSETAGNDTNDGSQASTLKTMSAALKLYPGKVVVMSDITALNLSSYKCLPAIEGYEGTETLTLASTLTLNADFNVDNLNISQLSEIVANGNKLTIGQNVTTSLDITVYGGKASGTLNGDTHVTLLGGSYNEVYGGGKSTDVNGNTYVVMGGNANSGKTIANGGNIYGGSYAGSVSGTTNVTLKDNAVVQYIAGAGAGADSQCYNTNVLIEGGQVENAYGGNLGSATLTSCNTKVTITGGTAEALFGGSSSVVMTGNATVELKGGTVTRRVYSGCYNEWNGYWSSEHIVNGTTTIVIYPGFTFSDSGTNKGIFAGSRIGSKNDSEKNTVIFQNNCYNTYKSYIKEDNTLGGFTDYTVKSGENGLTFGTNEAGKVMVCPDAGYVGYIGEAAYKNEVAVISSATTDVTFSVDENMTDEDEIKEFFKPENSEKGVRTKNPMGIRAVAQVDDITRAAAQDSEMGFIVTRKVLLGNTAPEDFDLNFDSKKMVKGACYDKENGIDNLWTSYPVADITSFSAAFVGIDAKYYDDVLVFRAYRTFKYKDVTYTTYGDPVSVTVLDIANAIIASETASQTDKDYAQQLIRDYEVTQLDTSAFLMSSEAKFLMDDEKFSHTHLGGVAGGWDVEKTYDAPVNENRPASLLSDMSDSDEAYFFANSL